MCVSQRRLLWCICVCVCVCQICIHKNVEVKREFVLVSLESYFVSWLVGVQKDRERGRKNRLGLEKVIKMLDKC